MLNKLINKINRKFRRTMDKFDINMEELEKMLLKDAILIDVRSPQEYAEEHIKGAISIPWYELVGRIKKEIPNKDKKIIICCQTGARSKKVQKQLNKLGYRNIYNLYNGIENY